MFQWGYAAVTNDGMVECLFNHLVDAEEYVFSVWEGYAYEAFCADTDKKTYLDYMNKVPRCLVPHIESYRVL